MKKIVRYVVGIDVAKDELVVCLGRMYDDWTLDLYMEKKFANRESGYKALIKWVKKWTQQGSIPLYVMEATGVYHENLAYFLDEQGCRLSVVLPNKIANYVKTLDVKTITDATASRAITRFGLERKLDLWKRPKDIFKKLRQLTRERGQIVDERTMVKNQLHAEQHGADPNKNSISRLRKRIALLCKQEDEVKNDIAQLVKQDNEVSSIIDRICTIPGVALLTAATILAETNGFELIRNRRQLTSYAGLDVKHKQSGTSVKGKPRISKRGNKYLRKAMYQPAMTAVRHNKPLKNFYARLVSKHGLKMKGLVAVGRKLLELTYTLFKNNTVYDQNYSNPNHRVRQQAMAPA
jgi:transposase